jgi:hypothetical protein
MRKRTEITHESPGEQTEKVKDDGVVNDSLGTVDPADSTGTDEENDSGDGEDGDTNQRED